MKFKNKKGISPLIATVLIIGFTIVLAALVITWGTKLFKGTVEQTGKTAEFSRLCSTGVDLTYTATSVTDPTTNAVTSVSVNANNNLASGTEGFLFIVKSEDGTKTLTYLAGSPTLKTQLSDIQESPAPAAVDKNEGLGAFATQEYQLTLDTTSFTETPTSVDVRPVVKSGSDYHVCESPSTVNIA